MGHWIESKTFENRIKKPSGCFNRTSWKMLGLDPIPTSFQSHPPTASHFSSGDLAGRVWVGSQGEAFRTAWWKLLELGHPTLWMCESLMSEHPEYRKALKDIQYLCIMHTSQTSMHWTSCIQTNITKHEDMPLKTKLFVSRNGARRLVLIGVKVRWALTTLFIRTLIMPVYHRWTCQFREAFWTQALQDSLPLCMPFLRKCECLSFHTRSHTMCSTISFEVSDYMIQ